MKKKVQLKMIKCSVNCILADRKDSSAKYIKQDTLYSEEPNVSESN